MSAGTGLHPNALGDFQFPKSHDFPPLYTLQPNPTTRLAQFQKWSRIIQLYCQHNRIFTLQFPTTLDLPLFRNTKIRKRLAENDLREILQWMAREEGGTSGEWLERNVFRVYWRRPEEWASLIYGWVEQTGQKGTVLTLYELLNGEATVGQDFHGMDEPLFMKALQDLGKKGKAQMFGEQDSRGVKFF